MARFLRASVVVYQEASDNMPGKYGTEAHRCRARGIVASTAALPGFLCGSLVSSDIGRQASHPQYAKTHRMLPRAMSEADSPVGNSQLHRGITACGPA